MDFEHSITIDAPLERVWEVMADVERWPEWTASMSEVRLVEVDRLAVGARARVRQPKLPPTTLEVTALEPQRGFTWVAKSPGVTFVGTHALAATDQGVRVTLGVSFRGALAGRNRALHLAHDPSLRTDGGGRVGASQRERRVSRP